MRRAQQSTFGLSRIVSSRREADQAHTPGSKRMCTKSGTLCDQALILTSSFAPGVVAGDGFRARGAAATQEGPGCHAESRKTVTLRFHPVRLQNP